ELHRAVARQALVLGRNLAGLVSELPRRIGEDGGKAATSREVQKVCCGVPPRFYNRRDALGTGRYVEQLCLPRRGTTASPACTTYTTPLSCLGLCHSRLRRFHRH